MTRHIESTREDSDAVEAPRTGFDIKEVLLFGLARTRWVGLALLALGTLLGLVLAAAQPNIYNSEAKLLLRLGEREQLTPEILVGGGEVQRDSRPTMQDEIHLLSNASIYEKVARELGPENVLRPVDPRRADGPQTPWYVSVMHAFQSWFQPVPGLGGDMGVARAAKILQLNTQLFTDRASNVITVVHVSKTPEQANAAVNELVSAFIQRHREQFSIAKYLDEGGNQLSAAALSRDAANKAWTDHIRECGFLDVATQRPALLAELTALESELATGRMRYTELNAQTQRLYERLKEIPAQKEEITPAINIPNPEYDTALELKRTLLVARRGLAAEGLPIDELRRREKAYDEQIANADGELQALKPRIVEVAEKKVMVPNPEHVEIKQKVDVLQLEALGLQKRIPALEERLEAKSQRLLRLRDCEPIHEQLMTRREEEKRKHSDMFDRYSKLQALSRIDIEDATNLRILQPATFNPEKVGPNRLKSLLLGVALGFFAAIGWAVLVQLADRRLRYPDTVERVLGEPVLCVVPVSRVLKKESERGTA